MPNPQILTLIGFVDGSVTADHRVFIDHLWERTSPFPLENVKVQIGSLGEIKAGSAVVSYISRVCMGKEGTAKAVVKMRDRVTLTDNDLVAVYEDALDYSTVTYPAVRPPYDAVARPKHYDLGNGMQVIDVIKNRLTPEEWRGYLKGTRMAYCLRGGHKDDELQDLRKEMQYDEWLKTELESIRAPLSPPAHAPEQESAAATD